MEDKKIIIYGGSSDISKELIKILSNDYDQFIIFCRNKNIVEKYLVQMQLKHLKIKIFEVDLLDLELNFSIIEKLENNISGIIWIVGKSGEPEEEFSDPKKCETNIRINFLNPVLIINKIIPKMKFEKKSFIAVLTSVAALRGRSKRLFYASAKSGLINYLSGLRQKLNKDNINVITVVPGYIRTKNFEPSKVPSFLVVSPKKIAQIIYKAIKSRKNVIYTNFIWRVIMFSINLIPEKIFKKLKF